MGMPHALEYLWLLSDVVYPLIMVGGHSWTYLPGIYFFFPALVIIRSSN